MGASPCLCCFLCSARGGKPLRLPTHIHTYLPRTTLLSRLSLPGTSPQHVQRGFLSLRKEKLTTRHRSPRVGTSENSLSREKDRADPTHARDARDARDGARVVSRVCSRAERSRKRPTPKNAKRRGARPDSPELALCTFITFAHKQKTALLIIGACDNRWLPQL